MSLLGLTVTDGAYLEVEPGSRAGTLYYGALELGRLGPVCTLVQTLGIHGEVIQLVAFLASACSKPWILSLTPPW